MKNLLYDILVNTNGHELNMYNVKMSLLLLLHLFLVGILSMQLSEGMRQYVSIKSECNFTSMGEFVKLITLTYYTHIIIGIYIIYYSCAIIYISSQVIGQLINILNSLSTWIWDITGLSGISGTSGYIYAWPLPWYTMCIKGSQEHLAMLNKNLVHLQAPNSLNKNLVWHETIKPLIDYHKPYWGEFKFRELEPKNNSSDIAIQMKARIISKYLSDYHFKINPQDNLLYLIKNNDSELRELHSHIHMELLIQQLKNQAVLPSHAHYVALPDIPNASRIAREEKFADGALVLFDKQVASIQCTFQHKCLAYDSYLNGEEGKANLKENLELYYNKYFHVDYVMVYCVNTKTLMEVNKILLQHPEWVNKIIPVDMSYQCYGTIVLNPHHPHYVNLAVKQQLELQIQIEKWNQAYEQMLPQMCEFIAEIHNKIEFKHGYKNNVQIMDYDQSLLGQCAQLYLQHKGIIHSDLDIKKLIQPYLFKNSGIQLLLLENSDIQSLLLENSSIQPLLLENPHMHSHLLENSSIKPMLFENPNISFAEMAIIEPHKPRLIYSYPKGEE